MPWYGLGSSQSACLDLGTPFDLFTLSSAKLIVQLSPLTKSNILIVDHNLLIQIDLHACKPGGCAREVIGQRMSSAKMKSFGIRIWEIRIAVYYMCNLPDRK